MDRLSANVFPDATRTVVDPASFLFVTLDSCRYDTVVRSRTPTISSIGPVHRAAAPGTFTFASHAAMFVGFTPGVASMREPFLNPKIAKVFKMRDSAVFFHPEVLGHQPFVNLRGANIIDGLKRKGYVAIGSGAVPWFNPEALTTQQLVGQFDHYYYAGDTYHLRNQLDFIFATVERYRDRPLFVFLNVGETHVPYYHEGADWDRSRNPCRPYADDNDPDECRRRQSACLEFVDTLLHPLVQMFSSANTVLCADHGDAWGEDGLWEHGIHHPKVIEVPLVVRLNARPETA